MIIILTVAEYIITGASSGSECGYWILCKHCGFVQKTCSARVNESGCNV